MSTDIADILKKILPDRQSLFQLKYFIIGKEPTIQGKLWQCLREIQSRQEALESMRLEVENAEDNLEIMELEVEKTKKTIAEAKENKEKSEEINEIEWKIIEINLRKAIRRKEILKKQLISINEKVKYKEEEMAFFIESFKALEKIEKVRSLDDPKAQTQYWSEKLAQDMNLRALMNAPTDLELIKIILSMPDNAPIKIQTVNMIESEQHALLALREKGNTNEQNL